jgi:Domain of unknown function (DUF4157)/Transglycosylase SLT domain
MRTRKQKPRDSAPVSPSHPTRTSSGVNGEPRHIHTPHSAIERRDATPTNLPHDFTQLPLFSRTGTIIQPKLQTNAPGDAWEQEANSVADRVMSGSSAPAERLSMKPAGTGSVGGMTAPPIVDEVLRSSGEPLPAQAREFMEPRFGHDFSQVRVHAGSRAAEAASALDATAFAAGRHIVFGENRFAPHTGSGRRLLAHELTHVVQQGGGASPGGIVQRQPDPAAEREKAVKRVVSPNVQMRATALTEVEQQLAKRMRKRQLEIQGLLDELGPNPKSKGGQDKVAALTKDLKKDLATIISEPDSKSVNPDLRKDIISSSKSVDAQKLKLKGAKEQWSKHDAIFAGKEVAEALADSGLSAAELKALVAQESGDLTEDDQEGDIAGIAQLGTVEEKKAGGKAGDRKKPEKAILLAAKILSMYAKDLDKALTVKPVGLERRKFIMAAYNAGVNAIATSQRKAIEMKVDGKTWESLIKGGKESALYKGLLDTYKDDKVPDKYKETTDYITKIYARIP